MLTNTLNEGIGGSISLTSLSVLSGAPAGCRGGIFHRLRGPILILAFLTGVHVLFVPGALAGSSDSVQSRLPVPPELEGLHERWAAAMPELDIPGMAVVVVRGNEVILMDTIGMRDPDRELPVTPDTMFYIASCTKTFTAAAIVALADEGKIDLDAPVKKYLPRFQIADAALTESVTIRDLLSHARGINSMPIVFLDAFTGEITEERFYRWLREATAKGKLGYSNLHYTLLGRVIEAVTDKSWKEYLAERLFEPSGMLRSTAFASRMYEDSDSAVPCDVRDGKFARAALIKTDLTMHAAGGMGTSISDLSRWLRINLNGGLIDGVRILPESGVLEMQKPQATGDIHNLGLGGWERTGYGFGWYTGTFRDHRSLDHGGGYTGAAAHVVVLPEEKFGVAVLCNAGGLFTLVVATDVINRLLHIDADDPLVRLKKLAKQRRERARIEEAEFPPDPVSNNGLSLSPDRYVGSYKNADWGTLRIEVRDGRLSGRIGDMPLRIGTRGRDLFVADGKMVGYLLGRFVIEGDSNVPLVQIDFPTYGEVPFKRE